MTLQERMAFRQELAYKAIREAFIRLEVISSMYRLRVQRVDDRGHNYIALIDTAESFQVGRKTEVKNLLDIESVIKKYAYDHYNINILGIYWRANTDKIFERQRRASDPIDLEIAEFQRARSSKSLSRVNDIIPDETELKAFFDALKKGGHRTPLNVNGKAYDTDLAPLR